MDVRLRNELSQRFQCAGSDSLRTLGGEPPELSSAVLRNMRYRTPRGVRNRGSFSSPWRRALAYESRADMIRACESPSPVGTDRNVETLLDEEIEDLWKFTHEKRPCPRANDATNRWELLELAEEHWTAEVDEITYRLMSAKTDEASTNNELYQILGFYIVFQGLLFGVASQSGKLTCSNWRALAILCSITTFYTLIGFLLKLHRHREKRYYAMMQNQQRNLRKKQISKLRQDGLQYVFPEPETVAIKFDDDVFYQVVFIIAFLFFSVAISACIHGILCPSSSPL